MRSRPYMWAATLALLTLTACALYTRTPPVSTEATAPGFELPTHTGGTVSLADLTRLGPAVIIFYRGNW